MIFPWKVCTQGHDLTVERAWIYLSGGSRYCRTCHLAALPPRRRK